MATNIDWPGAFGLPVALLDGYGYEVGDTTLRTQLVPGFGVINRQIYSDAVDSFNGVGFEVLNSQWAFFQGFWKYTLKGGTQRLNMRLWMAGTVESREVQPTGAYNIAERGANTVLVTFPIETIQGSTTDEDTYNAMLEYSGADEYGALIDAWNIFAEQEMPAPTFKEEA